VREILDSAHADARRILVRERVTLDRISAELLRRETLDEAAFRALLHTPTQRAEGSRALHRNGDTAS
jgi:ATP-dependent Zn protease